jgi:hypothetical protein
MANETTNTEASNRVGLQIVDIGKHYNGVVITYDEPLRLKDVTG